jgi:hypothetical protein
MSIDVRIHCPADWRHNHDVYNIPCAVIKRASGRIHEQLADAANMPAYAILGSWDDREYTCDTLIAMIRAWNNQAYRRPTDVAELSSLARALWDWECPIIPAFQDFALAVKLAHLQEDCRKGKNAQRWAFISVVFNWRPEFGRTVMDVLNLERAPLPSLSSDPGVFRWPTPIESSVLRYIISLFPLSSLPSSYQANDFGSARVS